MARKRSQERRESSDNNREEALTDAVVRLTEEMQAVGSTLEAIREELNWLTRNGIPPHADPPACHGVLKRMALDPTSEDWGDRLQIESGETQCQAENLPTREHGDPLPEADDSANQSDGTSPRPTDGKLF